MTVPGDPSDRFWMHKKVNACSFLSQMPKLTTSKSLSYGLFGSPSQDYGRIALGNDSQNFGWPLAQPNELPRFEIDTSVGLEYQNEPILDELDLDPYTPLCSSWLQTPALRCVGSQFGSPDKLPEGPPSPSAMSSISQRFSSDCWMPNGSGLVSTQGTNSPHDRSHLPYCCSCTGLSIQSYPRSTTFGKTGQESLKCPRCPDRCFSLPRDLR